MLPSSLSRRERQVMEIVFRCSSATVKDIRAAMPQPASYSAVRVIVNVLERKGHLKHVKNGRQYTYRPTIKKIKAVKAAVRSLVNTYFGDSLPRAVAAMIQIHSGDLSDDDVRELVRTIQASRERRS